jgi:hypothetical protein
VIAFRKGRDCRTHPAIHIPELHPITGIMDLANRIARIINDMNPLRVFIDGGGVGGGVVDRLMEMGYGHVVEEINFGGSSGDREYFNRRAHMYGNLREHLGNIMIENSEKLREQLLGIQYLINKKTRQTQLVAKEDMWRIDQKEFDWSDALALCFTYEVARDVGDRAGGVAGGPAARAKSQRYHPHGTIERQQL